MKEPATYAFIEEGRARAKSALAKSDKRTALAALSQQLAKSDDIADLAACVFCADSTPDGVDFDHATLISIDILIFMNPGRFDPEELHVFRQTILADAYFRLIERVRGMFGEHVAPRPVNLDEDPRRVLFITPQILGLTHAPSLRACEISRQLMKRAGKSVLIVNPNALPFRPMTTFGPTWGINTLPYDGLVQLNYEDVQLPIFNTREPEEILQRLVKVVHVAKQFDPHVVISQGDLDIAAELLSYIYPTTYLPTTSTEPITRAHVMVDFFDKLDAPMIDHEAVHGFAPAIRNFRLDLDLKPEKTEPQTRAGHGIPEDAFVITVAGSRLEHELTDGFCDRLADILEAAPRAHLVFVGGEATPRSRLEGLADRITVLGRQNDISSFFALCDCYINPPRVGGGRTAYLAVLEDVPVLCDPHGDAAAALGAEHALADVDAIRDAAIAMANDPSEHARWMERAKAAVDSVRARAQGFDALVDCIDDARRVFKDACKATALAAAE